MHVFATMKHEDLILTLTAGLAAALVLGYVTQRLGLSPIVGYLLAGIVVGHHTPGIKIDEKLAEQMAEIGVILLMFGVGLHFHVEDLWNVRRVAVPGAVVQSLVATALGGLAVAGFGWGWVAGVVFGLAISVASTVVLVRVLADNNDLHTPAGHVAVGWLVVEDLFTVVVLVVLPALFGGNADPDLFTSWVLRPFGGKEAVAAGGLPLALGLTAVKIGLLVGATFVVGRRLIPWLLRRVANTRSRELFTLTVLVVALGIAVGSNSLFGVSMALGAFLAGMVVGRSDFSLRAAAEALPMRDAFAVLFFVSVGMLFDPKGLLNSPGLAAATLAVVLLGKPLAALAIVLLLRYPLRVALAVAVALAQVGEFTFLLARLASQKPNPDAVDGLVFSKEFGPLAMNALVAAAILSISINPLLYRLVDPLASWLSRSPRLRRWLVPANEQTAGEIAPAVDARHRAIVVGYGPVGRTLCRLLRENEVEPIVVEMNLETVQRLRGDGLPAVYGDASHPETLKAAGVAEAGTLILSASGLRDAGLIIRQAREANARVRILVRCAYLRESPELHRAGADAVFTGEGEVALAMTESVLRDLGAVAEQIDRERDRVRAELFGVPSSGEAAGSRGDE